MIIALKTDYGSCLGMGHIHRMCSLAWYLNIIKGIKTYIVSNEIPDSFPDEMIPYLKDSIDFSPDIIIRDMRDSEEDEIIRLKKIAKVVTIDDNGPGINHADCMIEILPGMSPHERALQFNGFLYGLNFMKSLKNIKDKIVSKNINFSIYPGNAATEKYKNYLISLLPEKSGFAMLCGKNSYLQNNGEKMPINNTYAEVLLSSKIIITHFGVTLYEGFISKCRSIAINPTKYHSDLSDMIKEKINLINLGEIKNINNEEAAKTIEKALLLSPVAEKVHAEEVYNAILNDLEEFYRMVI